MGQIEDAIAALNKAIEANPDFAKNYYYRARAWELKKDIEKAKKDYYALLSIPQKGGALKAYPVTYNIYEDARKRLLSFDVASQQTTEALTKEKQSESSMKAKIASNERKIALVIGNSAYKDVGKLENPGGDAQAIAATFRRLGFLEVIEAYDLDYSNFRQTLKSFGDKAATSDWAVVYYAGHGIQMDNTNYLIPIDAKLANATHVADEAIPLHQVISKVNDAKKMRLVILDSCRDNPFSKQMIADGRRSRSIGRGLALIEPDAGTLVAFAARDGQIAEDGHQGQNSPYTTALIKHLEEPSVDIRLLFSKVRDTVMQSTGKKQEPFTYGSLPGIELFFK